MTAVGARSRYELWYGRDAEPARRETLRAGELTVSLEGAEIRSVRHGDSELLRGAYMAVRDERWDTVAGTLSHLEIDRAERDFAVRFEQTHAGGGLSFSWTGTIAGQADGTLSYELEGVAGSAFRYCRIGFCLLHPPRCAGRAYRGRGPDGPVEGTLPLEVGPQVFADGVYWPLFPSVSELELTHADGAQLSFTFEGDLFEMEDQRNWTDGSFKTYCTPQALGYPFDAQPGQRFWQKVTIRVSAPPAQAGPGVREPRLELDLAASLAMPPIGLGAPPQGELDLLRVAGPRHLRVDLDLTGDGWGQALAGAARAASELGCRLEVAAFATDVGQIDRLAGALTGVPVSSLLVFSAGAETTDPRLTARARAAGVGAPVIGGTDMSFAEVNRDPPDMDEMDGLVYSVTPQIHTFDEESIAQSLEAQPDTVRTARSFVRGKPIHVGPITLRPRDATDPVDPRQPSLFAAAFTLGSISALAQAGASSLTLYEAVGPRGIVGGDGTAYAMFHVFADIAELGSDPRLVRSRSNQPSRLAGLALMGRHRVLRVLVANLTPAVLGARIGPLPGAEVRLRALDADTAAPALADPLAFRSRERAVAPLRDGTATVELAPFAVTTLDCTPAAR
jgi:hypothetical protein